jgi:hypothetical protein
VFVAGALPGKYTTAEIAKAAGLAEDQVTHRLRHGLGVAHGIGHNRGDKGVITLVLPEGVPAEALVAGEAKAAAKGKPAAKAVRKPAGKGKAKPATDSASAA